MYPIIEYKIIIFRIIKKKFGEFEGLISSNEKKKKERNFPMNLNGAHLNNTGFLAFIFFLSYNFRKVIIVFFSYFLIYGINHSRVTVRRTRHCWRSKDELISDVLHTDDKLVGEQLELIYNSSVRTQDVAWKTCRKRSTIETNGERGSGESVHDMMMKSFY